MKLFKKGKLNTFIYIIGSLIVITITFIMFYRSIVSAEVDNVEKQLREVSVQSSVSVKSKLENSLKYVRGISDVVFDYYINDPKVREILHSFVLSSDFDSLSVVDENETTISTDDISYDDLKDIYESGEEGVFMSSIDGERVMVFAIANNEKKSFIYGIYTTEELNELLYITSFYGEGYTHIFKSNGDIILRSPHSSSAYITENIVEIFENSNMREGYTIDKIKNDMSKGKEGFVQYDYEGDDNRYAYYMPVDINDFYIISVVQASAIARYTLPLRNSSILLFSGIVSVFLVAEVVSYISKMRGNRRIIITNKKIDINRERYKLASDISESAVFEYMIEDRTLVFKNDWYRKYFKSGIINDVPNSLGILFRTSTEHRNELIDCFNKIIDGNINAEVEVCVKSIDDTDDWLRIQMTNIYDDNGSPIKAVGTINNVTEIKEAEIKYIKVGHYKDVIIKNSIFSCEVNITKDTVENIRYDNRFMYDRLYTYNDVLRLAYEKNIHKDDLDEFMNTFSIDSLINQYENGKREVSMRYRRILGDNYIWSKVVVYLTKNYETGEITGLMFVTDIDKMVKEEMKLKYSAEIDGLTQIYNRAALERKIKHCVNNNIEGILFIIDLDGFKGINDTYGHMAGDYILKTFAKKLSEVFRNSDIVGRLGGDEFCVFVKNISDEDFARKKGDKILKAFEGKYIFEGKEIKPAGTVGISFFPKNGMTYEEIFSKADKALYHAKHLGKYQYCIYDENEH